MTNVYFVRHAQPVHLWEDNRTRPLTADGAADSEKVTEFFEGLDIDIFISSPYVRSVNTISGSAKRHGMKIITDERLRERKAGRESNYFEMIRKRWEDFDFCEEDGESLKSVQNRNIQALTEILDKYRDKNIVIGTHGTALSTIINYYEKDYDCVSFFRMIYFMPYIVKMHFDKSAYTGREELLIVKKDFKG